MYMFLNSSQGGAFTFTLTILVMPIFCLLETGSLVPILRETREVFINKVQQS